ncbi:hypothetical protein A6A29_38815 [Streptomyces sp. TSRI0281]|nr:hypothetical protein A6A29_38815 [Streptomyces sp. TSRI0281]
MASPIPEAALPNLVTSRELPLAQTALGSLYSAGLLVGAGLGGVVSAAWGASATLVIDGASFAISTLLIARVRQPLSKAMTTRRIRMRADTAELWTFVRSTPVVSAFLWLTVGLRLCYGMVGCCLCTPSTAFTSATPVSGSFIWHKGSAPYSVPFSADGSSLGRCAGDCTQPEPLWHSSGSAILSWPRSQPSVPPWPQR